LSICDFYDEIDREEALQAKFAEGIKDKIERDKNNLECSKEQKDFLRTFVVAPLIPDLKDRYTELLTEDKYPEIKILEIKILDQKVLQTNSTSHS